MKYGFVYCLGNESFPNLYKIGCTERSPTQRSEEISRGTGVPSPYWVICYIECENPEQVEREVHQRLAQYRPNHCREFFSAPLELIAALFFHHRDNLAWVDRTLYEATGEHPWMADSPYQKVAC